MEQTVVFEVYSFNFRHKQPDVLKEAEAWGETAIIRSGVLFGALHLLLKRCEGESANLFEKNRLVSRSD